MKRKKLDVSPRGLEMMLPTAIMESPWIRAALRRLAQDEWK